MAVEPSARTCITGQAHAQHAAERAQADFGEALVVIGGVEQKAYFFALDLPHGDACYVRAYRTANTEAWLDEHIHAFAFFGAAPQSVLYDNDRCLGAKIMPNGERQRTQRFSAMLSHYVVRDRYGRPGKGNDKGKVEGLVGYSRRNLVVPPVVDVNMHCRAVNAAFCALGRA